jgi:hypothetical protein
MGGEAGAGGGLSYVRLVAVQATVDPIKEQSMKKKVRKLVLSKETVLHLQGYHTAMAGGAGNSLTDCMLISCIGDVCAETDPPCVVEEA